MGILDLLLPPSCAGCDAIGSPLCAACRASMAPPGRAADRFVAGDPGVVVGESLSLAVAALRYEGPTRRALGRLKYAGVARVAEELARGAAPALRTLLRVSGPAALVPVPIHATRARERGYNQALLIARGLAGAAALPLADVLARVRETDRQHRLDRSARLANLRDALRIADGARGPPVAIVVDDILTTSATLEACAEVLRRDGSVDVYGFTIAREV